MLSNVPTTRTTAGFGLVELLVAMTIMTLVSAVVLVNENSFKGAVVLRNQAYEISFMLRQMQLLAVSGPVESGTNAPRYGVQINQTDNTLIAFRDTNGNGRLDSGMPGEPIIERRRLDDRFAFAGIDVGGSDYNTVHIIFERPNFDALVHDNSGTLLPNAALITIGIPGRSEERTVEILDSGNISVLSN